MCDDRTFLRDCAYSHGHGPSVPLQKTGLAQYSESLNDAAADLRAAAIEPLRVGAAYALAAANTTASVEVLTQAFLQGGGEHLLVDGVRRSAMYGLAALPDNKGVPALLAATTDASGPMELRVCGVFGLGMCADPNDSAAAAALCNAVVQDQSAFVRSTAAHMLGFFGRRAAAVGATATLSQVLEGLRACLDPQLMHEFSPWQISPMLPSKLEEIIDAGATPPDPDSERMCVSPNDLPQPANLIFRGPMETPLTDTCASFVTAAVRLTSLRAIVAAVISTRGQGCVSTLRKACATSLRQSPPRRIRSTMRCWVASSAWSVTSSCMILIGSHTAGRRRRFAVSRPAQAVRKVSWMRFLAPGGGSQPRCRWNWPSRKAATALTRSSRPCTLREVRAAAAWLPCRCAAARKLAAEKRRSGV